MDPYRFGHMLSEQLVCILQQRGTEDLHQVWLRLAHGVDTL